MNWKNVLILFLTGGAIGFITDVIWPSPLNWLVMLPLCAVWGWASQAYNILPIYKSDD